MTTVLQKVVNDVQKLSQSEKNNLLKYLIASMDDTQDADSDQAWADLAEKRLDEIKSQKVQTLNWDQIKQQILS